MRKYIPEILQEIDNNPELLKTTYKDDAPLKVLLEHAFLPELKFDLPEGAPPFKNDAAPIGMTPVVFTSEFRRFYIFTKKKELPKIRKEQLFIQLLESIHPTEANILIHVKDQRLNKLYSNINQKTLEEAGFIPKVEVTHEQENGGVAQAKKS